MLRKLSTAATASTVAAAVAMLGFSTLPAAAATTAHPKVHNFTMPHVVGISAWGSYYASGNRVHVTVCVKETASNVAFALASGVAFGKSTSHSQQVVAQILGRGKAVCRSMTTKDTTHLYVQASSGTTDGHLHFGKLKRLY
jgi:hypothetical protein